MKLCTTCIHHTIHITSEGNVFCTRVKDAVKMNGIGRSVLSERDSIPEPQRPKGDKCGPDAMHWEGKA